MSPGPTAPDLVAALTDAARRWPDRPAWTFDPGPTLTFAEIDALTSAYAAALRVRGVTVGDRVGVLLRNRPEFPLTWFALMKLGATMVAINVNYRSVDLGHVLATSGATTVVSTIEFAALLAGAATRPLVHLVEDLAPQAHSVAGPVVAGPVVAGPVVAGPVVAGLVVAGPVVAGPVVAGPVVVGPVVVGPVVVGPIVGGAAVASAADAAMAANIQFTSGTTGSPKGCVLSHRYWLTLGASLVEHFPRLGPEDVMLTAQPFHYVDPMWNVVAALLAGARLVVLDGFHPSTFWAKVREHRVTYFYCLGAMPTLLLRMPVDPADRDHRVRVVQASAIPPALHAALEERWGVDWFEAFGMTETGADLRITDLDHDALVGTGCLGLPAPHREAKVVDGQLWLRGPGMMQGYLGQPDPFVDGWFATGDLAEIDADGRVYHRGRLKDMIRRSGENIAAHEVEEVILSHPRVRLAAVIGVPDEIRGEEVKAFVVGDVGVEELTRWCAERLAAFKVPSRWEFRGDLPRTASERVAKERLR